MDSNPHSRNAYTKTRQHLLSLPQELIDIIFELAYSETYFPLLDGLVHEMYSLRGNKRLAHPRAWSARRAARHFAQRVRSFLVSKAFFHQAASAWLRPHKWGKFPYICWSLIHNGLFRTHATEVSVGACQGEIANLVSLGLPELEKVHLQVLNDHQMQNMARIGHVCFWAHELSDDLLRRIFLCDICRMSTLPQHVELSWLGGALPSPETTRSKNMLRLSELLQREIVRTGKTTLSGNKPISADGDSSQLIVNHDVDPLWQALESVQINSGDQREQGVLKRFTMDDALDSQQILCQPLYEGSAVCACVPGHTFRAVYLCKHNSNTT